MSPVQPHDMTTELPGETYGMLLVGKEQSGKSRLAATAKKPVLFVDTDKKAESLRGMKDIYALTYTDPPNTYTQPTAITEISDMISRLEAKNSLKSANAIFPDVPVGTLVFDSVATLAECARKHILYTNAKELAYSVTIGQRTFRVPKSWTAWEAEKDMIATLILQARAIPGLNVIATLHEAMEQDERSTEENPMYTGRVSVYPARYNGILKYFAEIWRLTRPAAGMPIIATQPTYEFQKAGTAIGGIEPLITNNADIESIIRSRKK